MIYIYAFLLAGGVCALGQLILDNTKLTPGHITSLFTVGGAVLSFCGIYEKLIEKCGAGATVLISNFGHSLYTSGLAGIKEEGILGLFSSLYSKAAVAIVAAVVFSFIFTLFFKPKN